MHRPVYQVCDTSSCNVKIKVKRQTPLLLLAAEVRFWPACRRTWQVPHRVRRLTSYAQEPQRNARKLHGSTHVAICSLCFLTWQVSSSRICHMRLPLNAVRMHADLQGMCVA
jgi:hypothetical protein